jgi:hypothetical protein
VNARCAPEWISQTHSTNQIPHIFRHARSTNPSSTFPRPVKSKPPAMPGNDGFGFHHQ